MLFIFLLQNYGAQSIGSLIDSLDNPHILGTVAGDDTIFLVVKTTELLVQVMEYFQKLVID